MTFFACRSLLTMFLINSSFVLTRWASSSRSASRSPKSRARCSALVDFGTPSRLAGALSASCGTACRDLLPSVRHQDCFSFPDFFPLLGGGCSGQENLSSLRSSPWQTSHLFSQWKIEWSPPHKVHFKILRDKWPTVGRQTADSRLTVGRQVFWGVLLHNYTIFWPNST